MNKQIVKPSELKLVREFDPSGRTYHRCKHFGQEVVSNLSYLNRRGLVWQWRSPIFNGTVWGSELGSVDCLLSAGLHDLSHAIDFVMCGRTSNITLHGLMFRRPWANSQYVQNFGWLDGSPKTSQATRSEIRTFALQAVLMEREAGALYDLILGHELDSAKDAGLITGLRDAKEHQFFDSTWHRDNGVLASCSIEEYALDKGALIDSPGFPDDYVWIEEKFGKRAYRKFFDTTTYRERKNQMIQLFADDLIAHYNRYKTNPFAQKRIDAALTVVAERLRSFHKAVGFKFDPAVHYGTPA